MNRPPDLLSNTGFNYGLSHHPCSSYPTADELRSEKRGLVFSRQVFVFPSSPLLRLLLTLRSSHLLFSSSSHSNFAVCLLLESRDRIFQEISTKHLRQKCPHFFNKGQLKKVVQTRASDLKLLCAMRRSTFNDYKMFPVVLLDGTVWNSVGISNLCGRNWSFNQAWGRYEVKTLKPMRFLKQKEHWKMFFFFSPIAIVEDVFLFTFCCEFLGWLFAFDYK
jgi:hypothetical protein